MVAYRITLEPDDNDTLLVRCPDIPGVITFGASRDDAVFHAVDAIESMVASLMRRGEHIAPPSPTGRLRRNEAMVALPALSSLKLELYWAMKKSGVTRAELMRRLKWNRESVDRLFRLEHASRLDQLEAAFRALGRTVDIKIEKAA